jgi:nucleoside-diphosphate-sugar epimerase
MRIVLTGHQGFIGSNLHRRLLNLNHEVIGLDIRSGNDILSCDLPECDLVIHLAAKTGVRDSLTNPKEYWEVNVNGTRRILDHYHDKRILVASSSSQYEPYLNPYAASKYVIEKISHKNTCFMRFHTVFSEEPRSGMFFDKLLKKELTYVTDHERDFIHVDDVCNAVEILLTSDVTGPIDIGSGQSVKILDFVSNLPIIDAPHERKKTLADISILKSLGFSPTHSVLDFYHKRIRR